MNGDNVEGQVQQVDGAAKEVRFEMRVASNWVDHVRDVSNYAASIGVIPNDHRGNVTAWVNYCLNLGEEMLKQREAKARGYT